MNFSSKRIKYIYYWSIIRRRWICTIGCEWIGSGKKIMLGSALQPFPRDTMIGALAHYVSNTSVTDFQPMCASFSLIER